MVLPLAVGGYEIAVLITGSAGITFTLGDIVGRCLCQGRKNGEKKEDKKKQRREKGKCSVPNKRP